MFICPNFPVAVIAVLQAVVIVTGLPTESSFIKKSDEDPHVIKCQFCVDFLQNNNSPYSALRALSKQNWNFNKTLKNDLLLDENKIQEAENSFSNFCLDYCAIGLDILNARANFSSRNFSSPQSADPDSNDRIKDDSIVAQNRQQLQLPLNQTFFSPNVMTQTLADLIQIPSNLTENLRDATQLLSNISELFSNMTPQKTSAEPMPYRKSNLIQESQNVNRASSSTGSREEIQLKGTDGCSQQLQEPSTLTRSGAKQEQVQKQENIPDQFLIPISEPADKTLVALLLTLMSQADEPKMRALSEATTGTAEVPILKEDCNIEFCLKNPFESCCELLLNIYPTTDSD